MNLRLHYILYLFLPLLLFSCFPEDERVEPHPPGDEEVATIAMSQYYNNDEDVYYYINQVYFDLGTNNAPASNEKEAWDLAFESTEDGTTIRLNTSRFMLAANSGIQDFLQVTDTIGLKWKFDQSDGNPESTAIGNWFEMDGQDTIFPGYVYVIDLGYDKVGNPKGIIKAVFQNIKNGTYSFRMANLDGSGDNIHTVTKVTGYNYVYFSIEAGSETLLMEPEQNGWDIMFTQYTTTLYTNTGEPEPYLVTGVLINPYKVRVAKDTIEDFESITKDIIVNYEFSDRADIIGYEWKDYDFEAQSYTVDPTMVYFLRDTEGLFYKMRFVGFYDSNGEKGFPSIEFQRL